MSNLKEVTVVYLQATTTFPGVFSTQTTLSKANSPNVKMFWSDKGLLITHGNVTAIIPTTNVKLCVFKDVQDYNQGE